MNNSFGSSNNNMHRPVPLVFSSSARFDKGEWFFPHPEQQLQQPQSNLDEMGSSGSTVTCGEENSGQEKVNDMRLFWTAGQGQSQQQQHQPQQQVQQEEGTAGLQEELDSIQKEGAAQLREELDSPPLPRPQRPRPAVRPVYPGIREVWKHNLRKEIMNIVALSRGPYEYISIDTEFPGVVARPVGGKFKNPAEYNYQLLRANCDILRLIQFGITLMDKDGNLAPGIHTWEFNFHFSLNDDMYARDSIEMLMDCGLLFEKHETDGIKANEFAELFIMSGLMLNEDVKWISFHGGYDCGYLYKLLSGRPLPLEELAFLEELRMYFPVIYDIKYLMMSCRSLRQGGLQELATTLGVERIGEQHQAGSDSLITGAVFFRMKEEFFEGIIEDEKYNGHIYGFGSSYQLLEQSNS